MSKTILAVGAGGKFAGMVIPALAERGAEVRGFVHDAADADTVRDQGASEIAIGDLGNAASVAAALKGIDRVRDVLVENTERFAKGLPANNALLWGARGMGKSSLVKAAHAGVNATLARQTKSGPLKLIEIHREDIQSLPDLMTLSATSLDDPGQFSPQVVTYASRGHAWDTLDPSLPTFERMPPG